MLSRKREYQPIEATEAVWNLSSDISEVDDDVVANTLTRFHSQFTDCMEMYAPTETVASYLNTHRDWFCRCASPMKVEQLGQNGYALTIGRFGAFGYEVEPKVGLELLPADNGIYRIRTLAVPDYVAFGYDVDFKAVMQLVEKPAPSAQFSGKITAVEWQLDLAVDVQFPKFIHRLPKSLIQKTGDRLINQVVRQVSRRLTYKVQADFHKSIGIPFPLD